MRDLTERAETKKTFDALKLTRVQLDHLVMSKEVMANWGYITDIPDGVGGDQPSEENKSMPCDRCGQNFQVKRMSEAQECAYHYGRPRMIKVNGTCRWRWHVCFRFSSVLFSQMARRG